MKAFAAAGEWLDKLPRMNLKLTRVRKCLRELGHPERVPNTIHITGTNGKGSTCAMVESVLREAGHKTGMYTSPHLENIRERIQVNGEWISEEEFVEVFERIKNIGVELTFFEFLTCMAFQHFVDEKVEYAVIEVGMGGRLDATNVVKPKVSIITNISLEHQQHLGETLGEIAKEKAGIVKARVPVVTAEKTPSALRQIEVACREKKAPLHLVERQTFMLSLQGEHQQWNAALAAKACALLGVGEMTIRRGLKKAYWPGRLEQIGHFVLDSAHNPAGMKALAEYAEGLKREKLILVVGIKHDKDVNGIVENLPDANVVIVTQAKGPPKPFPARKLGEKIKGSIVIKKVADALEHANTFARQNDLVLVCGSLFVVSEARACLK